MGGVGMGMRIGESEKKTTWRMRLQHDMVARQATLLYGRTSSCSSVIFPCFCRAYEKWDRGGMYGDVHGIFIPREDTVADEG